MDNRTIRKRNLDLLIHRTNGVTNLAERVASYRLSRLQPGEEVPDPLQIGKYIKQILKEFQGKKDRTPRGVGSPFAKNLEGTFNLEIGWMDTRHDAEWAEAGITPNVITEHQENAAVKEVTTHPYLTNELLPLGEDAPFDTVQHVPILSWETCMTAHNNYDKLSTAPTYPVRTTTAGRLIALEMPDDSMEASAGPSFPAGTTLIFDLDLPPDNALFVLFKAELCS